MTQMIHKSKTENSINDFLLPTYSACLDGFNDLLFTTYSTYHSLRKENYGATYVSNTAALVSCLSFG